MSLFISGRRRKRAPKSRGTQTTTTIVKRGVARGPRGRAKLSRQVHAYSRWMSLQAAYDLGATGGLNLNGTTNTPVIQGGNLVTLTAVNSFEHFGFGYSFQLRHLPSISDLTSLYDQYKVNGIRFQITPLYNNYTAAIGGSANGSNGLPVLHWVIDQDSAAPPAASTAGIDELRQYGNYKTKLLNGQRMVSRYFKPHIAQGVSTLDETATVAPAVVVKARKLDCAYESVDHFGIRGLIETFNPNTTAAYNNFKIECKVYLTFYNTR